MARNDPALLSERMRSPFQREQKPWDKVVMAVMLAFWIGWLVVMGLDARYHGSDVPTALKAVGLALIVLGSYLVGLTLKANSYAAPVVKIQTGRGHAVATSGPYAYVRHPMYAGALLVPRRRAPPPRFLVGTCRGARPCPYYRAEGRA